MGPRLTVLLCLLTTLTASAGAEKLNITLVMADDQGWGDTGIRL